ncbi:MAG: porin family protein [Bacteroidetes bacterium]|nr:porin family protein [Bacteroidota bacterium]
MKKVLLSLLLLFVAILLSAQNKEYEDVVYLKNGSIIYGQIVEQVPGEYIKIKSGERNVFVFRMEEIDKIVVEEKKPPISPRKQRYNSIQIKKKGYEALVGTSFFVSPPYFFGENENPTANGFGVSLTNAYRFSPRFSIGVGIGFERYDEKIKALPVFIDIQYLFVEYPVAPAISLNGGYAFGWSTNESIPERYKTGDEAGISIAPMIGVKFVYHKHASLFLRLGYKLQELSRYDVHYNYPSNSYSVGKYFYNMILVKAEFVY